MKYTDVNNNGILDSHEKWFLGVKIIVFVWSLFFLTYSYLGNKEVDRLFVGTTFTASAASFSLRRKPK
jgi:uncharacterized BrkB/YihY/UPF0761 family membrane protein